MPSAADGPSWLHLAALFGLSAATLAFEILLLRLFEFSHWHYFAGFAIALALLGLGAAGTTLALLGAGPQRWGDGWFLGNDQAFRHRTRDSRKRERILPKDRNPRQAIV